MRRILYIACILFFILVPFNITLGSESVKVVVHGNEIIFDKASEVPFIDDAGRTQVPVRKVCESAGMDVEWISETNSIKISKFEKVIEMFVGKKIIKVDGVEIPIDNTIEIINMRAYMPIRPVMEAFDYNVEWRDSDSAVILNFEYTSIKDGFYEVLIQNFVEDTQGRIKTEVQICEYNVSSKKTTNERFKIIPTKKISMLELYRMANIKVLVNLKDQTNLMLRQMSPKELLGKFKLSKQSSDSENIHVSFPLFGRIEVKFGKIVSFEECYRP